MENISAINRNYAIRDMVGPGDKWEISNINGNYEIQGASANDRIELLKSSSNGRSMVDVRINGTVIDRVPYSEIHTLTVYGNTGDDAVSVDSGLTIGVKIEGGKGNDSIYGGSGNDQIYGGDGNDILYGRDGNDVIRGDAGTDTIYGQAGDDNIEGGDGNDLIYGGAGNDKIKGENGNDTIFGGSGNDSIDGQNGNDQIDGGSGQSLPVYKPTPRPLPIIQRPISVANPRPGAQNVAASLKNGKLIVNGGSQNDVIKMSMKMEGNRKYVIAEVNGQKQKFLYNDIKSITINGKAGNDTISISQDIKIPATINGGAGNDKITGGRGNDIINGGAGNDVVNGRDGNDTIRGGSGNDKIKGDKGNDTLYGGKGNDKLKGGAGKDKVYYSYGDKAKIGKGDILYVTYMKNIRA